MSPSLKQFDAIQRTAGFHLFPVAIQVATVGGRPFFE